MAIRKDANLLSVPEREELVAAIKELKSTGIYDLFVLRHANAIMRAIHRSPAFLPWHRRFIWDYEKELQRVSGNPNLGLPYWNWPSGSANASMWDDNFLGGDGVPGDQTTAFVRSGPFREGQWNTIDSSGNQVGPLRRAFGRRFPPPLPTQANIDQVLAVTPYDNAPWNEFSDQSFRNELEGWRGPNLHNRGHLWVDGSMFPMTSPNDPVFFIHHCMVDKIWYEWQLRFPNQGYLPTSGGLFGQNLTDPMDSTPPGPIGQRPIDVLDMAALEVEYDQLMPGTPAPIPTPIPNGGGLGQLIEVGDGPTEAGIGAAGEVDVFRFKVPAFETHTIETFGPSDTVITLFGPNDSNAQIAFNDDGGENFNSRITLNLSAGTYYVRVQLYNSGSTGNYSIQVLSSEAPSIPALVVNDPPISAAISAGSESDLYRFQVGSEGTYTIETNGITDTFLTLFGPNTQALELARDDDSGNRFNSRIRIPLSPGEYFARVRHYSPFGTGPYQLSVKNG